MHHQDAAAVIDAAAAWLGSRFQEGATWQRRVHGAGRRSHYSYNEIIMTGALRPHHRNIYCIIYSASPLVQGERTHINLQARRSAPHSSCCLLRSRLSSLLSFFPLLFPSFFIYSLLFFVCLVFVVLFFFLVAFQAAAQGWSICTTGPQHSCGRTLPAPSIFYFFFIISCFFAFLGEQRPVFVFLFLSQKCDSVQCGFSVRLFLLLLLWSFRWSSLGKRFVKVSRFWLWWSSRTTRSSSEGELGVEHMCHIIGLIDWRKSRTAKCCSSGGSSGWWQLHHGNGGGRGAGSVTPPPPSPPPSPSQQVRRLLSGWAGANCCWLAGRALT